MLVEEGSPLPQRPAGVSSPPVSASFPQPRFHLGTGMLGGSLPKTVCPRSPGTECFLGAFFVPRQCLPFPPRPFGWEYPGLGQEEKSLALLVASGTGQRGWTPPPEKGPGWQQGRRDQSIPLTPQKAYLTPGKSGGLSREAPRVEPATFTRVLRGSKPPRWISSRLVGTVCVGGSGVHGWPSAAPRSHEGQRGRWKAGGHPGAIFGKEFGNPSNKSVRKVPAPWQRLPFPLSLPTQDSPDGIVLLPTRLFIP